MEEKAARKAARQAERRQRILDAARDVVRANGAAGLTVTAVAKRAHLTPPAIYYWFEDMHALTEAIAEEMLGQAMREMVTAVARSDSGLDALEGMMRSMVEHYSSHPEAFELLHDNVARTGVSDAFKERVVYPRTLRLNGALEALLLADQARGDLQSMIDVRALTHVAWCTALGIVGSSRALARLGAENPVPASTLLDVAIENLRRGARP